MRKFALDKYDRGMVLGWAVLFAWHLMGLHPMPDTLLEGVAYLAVSCLFIAAMNRVLGGYRDD